MRTLEMRAAGRVPLSLLIAAAAWGCESSPARDAADAPPWPTIEASRVLPTLTIAGVCRTGEGDAASESPYRLERVDDAAWELDVEGAFRARWELGGDGVLRLPWRINHAEGVRVEYDPALVLAPGPEAGATTTEADVVVIDLDGGAVKTRGTCVYSVGPFMGDADAPAGAGDAALLVRSTLELKLTLASARVESVTAFGEGAGPIGEHATRVVRPFNLVASPPEVTARRFFPDPAADPRPGDASYD